MTTNGGYYREALFTGLERDDDGVPHVFQIRLVQCLDGLTVGILHQRMGDVEEHVDDVLTLPEESEAHDMFFEHWGALCEDEELKCAYTDGPPPDAAGMVRRKADLLGEMLRESGAPQELIDMLSARAARVHMPEPEREDQPSYGYGMYL